MVHGGGWRVGDKAIGRVVQEKVNRWVPKGFILISANYRMLPASVSVQASDVQAALVAAQQRAGTWGGDPGRFILMGRPQGLTWWPCSTPARRRPSAKGQCRGWAPWRSTVP